MVGRCGLSPWGLTWDHQPKPHQLDHPEKNTIFSQLPTSNIKTYCWHELFPPSVDHSGQPARQPAQRNRPCGTFHKKCSAGFSFTSFGIFFCFFVVPSNVVCKYLGVVWIVLLLGPIQAQSVGQGCLHCFFILARKMEMFGKQPVRWFQCWKTRGWCWRSSSWSLGAEGECRPSLEWEKVKTDNVKGRCIRLNWIYTVFFAAWHWQKYKSCET